MTWKIVMPELCTKMLSTNQITEFLNWLYLNNQQMKWNVGLKWVKGIL